MKTYLNEKNDVEIMQRERIASKSNFENNTTVTIKKFKFVGILRCNEWRKKFLPLYNIVREEGRD